MKKVILRILMLVLPFALAGGYIEYRLKKIPNSYSVKRADFETQLDSTEVLVLGNSESLFGIEPRQFDKNGFNAANVSQTIFYDCAITMKYAAVMPRLKYVIVNLTYFSLGNEIIDDIESWRDYAYYQYWGIRYPELSRFDAKLYSTWLLYTPLTSLSYTARNFNVTLDPGNDKDGWGKLQTGTHEVGEEFSRKTVAYHTSRYKEARVAANVKAIIGLIGYLKQRNVSTVLITTPVHQSYLKFCDTARLAQNQRDVARISEITGARYLNYEADKRFAGDDDLFENSFHLNQLGAIKFSRILNDDALK